MPKEVNTPRRRGSRLTELEHHKYTADAYKKAYAAADAEEQAAGDEHADAADDDGYRGGYVAASTRLTDGTYSESALGKHHKSAAAAEEEEEEKPKGYQSSYTINPYGVKDPEETDVDEKEEDVPVEKPHGYVASSTRLTDGSMTRPTMSPRWAARASSRRRRRATPSTGPTSCRSPRTTTTSPPTTRSWSW